MSVWDVPDERIAQLGRQVGALAFVTHCYHRRRPLPHWPYNLFARVHGGSRAELMAKVVEIAGIIGSDGRAWCGPCRAMAPAVARLFGDCLTNFGHHRVIHLPVKESETHVPWTSPSWLA